MDKFGILQRMGAGEFEHFNGLLEAHLRGAAHILKSWGGSDLLQTAGLFHAAYGTAGFSAKMVLLSRRREIAHVIGEAEEALVYLYCSCDRNFVFPQFGNVNNVQFKDRFSGDVFELTDSLARLFCELTVANELDILCGNREFKEKYGSQLLELFFGMDRYLSPYARKAYSLGLSDIA